MEKMNLAIYGAQSIALGAYKAISHLYPQREITCFIVTKRGANTETLAGLPVVELEDYVKNLKENEKENTEILIATPENVMPDIERVLDEQGLFCHTRLTSMRWGELMGYHYADNPTFRPLYALPVGFHAAKVKVFMAKFYKDKELSSSYHIPEWITPIQVGAALCKERVADFVDNMGENISEKNGNYSELTALYWMWKNCIIKEQKSNVYYGLAHYRRILELSEDDILRLTDNEIDVVLPYPMPYEPNIEAHHERYLNPEDWNALVLAVMELQPEYAKHFPETLNQMYLYNYNILLARKEVLSDFCSWLFPILERAEELSIPKGCERNDRYIGYMGETLTTLYFMVNKERWNIAHATCRFLV